MNAIVVCRYCGAKQEANVKRGSLPELECVNGHTSFFDVSAWLPGRHKSPGKDIVEAIEKEREEKHGLVSGE